MKVRIIKTGEIVDVNTDRAKYWILCKYAELLNPKTDHPDIIKVDKTPVEKQAYKKEKLNKKAEK